MPQAVSASSAVHELLAGRAGQRAGGGTVNGVAPLSELGGKLDMSGIYARHVPALERLRGVLGSGG